MCTMKCVNCGQKGMHEKTCLGSKKGPHEHLHTQQLHCTHGSSCTASLCGGAQRGSPATAPQSGGRHSLHLQHHQQRPAAHTLTSYPSPIV